MRPFVFLPAASPLLVLLLLAGCAGTPSPDAPVVSIVNSLSFDHAMSGKRDGLRSAWPKEQLAQTTEQFPLAQIKQCDKDKDKEQAGADCRWGVLKAKRTVGKVQAVPGGVALAFELELDIDRSQRAHGKGQNAAMTIPADVAALQLKRTIKQDVVLQFGKAQRFDAEYGVSYELCALRLNAARQPIDKCEVAYY